MTRLRLRRDAYYAPTGDGICFITNSGEVAMTGPSIFRWVDRLAPYLDGRYTLAELTSAMPPERKMMTERVVNALLERRLLVEVDPERDPQDEAVADQGPTLGDRRVLLVGAGAMLVETARAALGSGARWLRVAVTGECPTQEAMLAGCAQRGRRRDLECQIVRVAVDPADEERLAELVAEADLVVYACDHAVPGTARILDRLCAGSGLPVAAALGVGESVWLGPFGSAGERWPGFMSAWRRLLALGGAAAPDGQPPPGAALTVAANQFIREVRRRLSDLADDRAELVEIELQSLRTHRRAFLPHPFSRAVQSPGADDLTAAIDRLRSGEPIGAEEFSRRATACLEGKLGVLGEVEEHDYAQVPLAVSQVRVSDPVLLLGQGQPPAAVFGAGLSLAAARRAAVLRGLAVYGTLMVDPRRLFDRRGAARPAGDPEHALAAVRAGIRTWHAWGIGLADGQPRAVPARAAFPALHGASARQQDAWQPGRRYALPPGAAGGYDWAEALRDGLVGQCRRLTMAELARGERPLARVDWHQIATDGQGERYRSLADIVPGRLEVYDVTGSLQVPTLAFCLDDVAVAYASGLSYGAALRDGLAEVLLARQAKVSGDVGYAPDPVPPLPARGLLPGVRACPTWSTDTVAAASRLASAGWAAVAVPLDHDREVTAIMPYLIHVVVTRA